MAGVHVDSGTPNAVLAVDVDHDGAPDVIATDQASDTISILLAP